MLSKTGRDINMKRTYKKQPRSSCPYKIESPVPEQEESLLDDIVTAAAIFVAVEDMFESKGDTEDSFSGNGGSFGGGGADTEF